MRCVELASIDDVDEYKKAMLAFARHVATICKSDRPYKFFSLDQLPFKERIYGSQTDWIPTEEEMEAIKKKARENRLFVKPDNSPPTLAVVEEDDNNDDGEERFDGDEENGEEAFWSNRHRELEDGEICEDEVGSVENQEENGVEITARGMVEDVLRGVLPLEGDGWIEEVLESGSVSEEVSQLLPTFQSASYIHD